jgi:hypothetical protein
MWNKCEQQTAEEDEDDSGGDRTEALWFHTSSIVSNINRAAAGDSAGQINNT